MAFSSHPPRLAIVGATGNVGRTILSILSEKGFPKTHIRAIASEKSGGKSLSYGDQGVVPVIPLSPFDFRGIDIALFSPGSLVSKEHAPKAASQGCIVIDNSSYFRMDPDIPLIVPEVNLDQLHHYKNKNIIANPNCSTIQLVVALKPLHDRFIIKRVVASTYQSVSGAGKKAMDELYYQTKGSFVNDPVSPQEFTKPIAFNVIPHIDVFMKDGFTKEEWKMRVETKKILSSNIDVIATCVRVPVFIGHAIATHIEFDHPITCKEAKNIFKKTPGLQVVDNPEHYLTPSEISGEDLVYVSRIRQDPSFPNSLCLWIVADNIRKGAALNAIQIAEALINMFRPNFF